MLVVRVICVSHQHCLTRSMHIFRIAIHLFIYLCTHALQHIFNTSFFFIGFQASQEVYVPRVSTLIIAVTSDGPTKITKRLIWVHVGRPIHSVVLHMPKELFLKKCK